MSIQLTVPPKREMKPRIIVLGIGGAGGNAVNNMVTAGLEGVEFVVTNTDAQALTDSKADRRIQIGSKLTEGLGAGSNPEIGRQAAEETMAEIVDVLQGSHMIFVTAGMGGGTGTGAAPVIARAARELGILTIGVVTKPFDFEGRRRMESAITGIEELAEEVDTLIIIPNQNLFRIANAQTTFAEAFAMADEVLHSGVAGITDLMVKHGLINLDFADVRTVMNEMGKAMMGTGEAQGENRAVQSAEMAIANPLLDDVSMQGASGVLISISGGEDMTLYEVDEAANRIKQEVDDEANIIIGSTFDDKLSGVIRVSVVATGIGKSARCADAPTQLREVTPVNADAVRPEIKIPEFEDGEAAMEEPEEVAMPADALPGFLQPKQMQPPRRELSRRSRSFLERVLGRKNPEEVNEADNLDAETASHTVQSAEAKNQHKPKDDMPPSEVMAILDALDADTTISAMPVPVADAEPAEIDDLEPVPQTARGESAEPLSETPLDFQEPVIDAPEPPSIEAPEPAQTRMQTAANDAVSSLDSEALDIPAFLRR